MSGTDTTGVPAGDTPLLIPGRASGVLGSSLSPWSHSVPSSRESRDGEASYGSGNLASPSHTVPRLIPSS